MMTIDTYNNEMPTWRGRDCGHMIYDGACECTPMIDTDSEGVRTFEWEGLDNPSKDSFFEIGDCFEAEDYFEPHHTYVIPEEDPLMTVDEYIQMDPAIADFFLDEWAERQGSYMAVKPLVMELREQAARKRAIMKEISYKSAMAVWGWAA
jgi:hypothetical protein